MYAVIETGGKQYRVQPGDFIQVEKLEGEVGSSLKFDRVLFFSQSSADNVQILMGKPYIQGAQVQAEVVGQGRGSKILIVKMKRRKQYRRTQGHRQNYTQVLITDLYASADNQLSLSSEEKKTKLAQFQSHLKPKGKAFTARRMSSKKKTSTPSSQKAAV